MCLRFMKADGFGEVVQQVFIISFYIIYSFQTYPF